MIEAKINNPIISYCIVHNLRLLLLAFISLAVFMPREAKAQYSLPPEKIDAFSSYDPLLISVYLNPNLSFELEVIITDSNDVYINVEDLFRNLEIPCTPENNGNNLTGFIETESKPYSIYFNSKLINLGDETVNTKNGLFKEAGIIYIESSLLASTFGLTLTFNPRSLSATLAADFELPFLKKMRLENTRNNISKLQGEQVSADTVVKRTYHLFKFGMLDWAISSFQAVNQPIYNYISLGAGAELLYGQANVSFNYNNQFKYDERQLQYSWRWVDNDKSLIRQAQLGIINKQEIALLNSPVIGASISNSPTTFRKSTGHYTINEYTEPNWTVELYINDILLDYTTADASGLYTFKVPIVYGYTVLRFKFYSPLGEERTEERVLNVPFTFLPANTCEYEFLGGILQADKEAHYGLGNINYGVTRFMTVGAGLEYLSSIPNRPLIPFAKIAVQPSNKMVLNLEYAQDVRVKGLLNYYLTQNAFIEIDYEKYKEGQLATKLKALEERKINLTIPLRFNKFSILSKVNLNQFVYKYFKYNQINFVFSAFYRKFSANSAFLINWVSNEQKYLTTNLSLSYRHRNGLVFRPLIEYNLSENNIIRYRLELEKRVQKTYFSIAYERNVLSKSDNIFFTLRYDLPFARVSMSALNANSTMSFAESAYGSLAFGGDNNYVKASNNSSIGKGGILIYPFLDLNNNGIQDNGEQKILLSSVKVAGGKPIVSEKDSIVRISDLNAFVYYNVEFSHFDLENIAWRFKHKTYQIMVDPNGYKRVYVPIISVGEVNGMVYLDADSTSKGAGRITVQIFDKNGQMVAETLSEPDGYFSYLGLKPGNYTLRVDAQQLDNLHYQSFPISHECTINISEDGDIVKNLDFYIKPQ